MKILIFCKGLIRGILILFSFRAVIHQVYHDLFIHQEKLQITTYPTINTFSKLHSI